MIFTNLYKLQSDISVYSQIDEETNKLPKHEPIQLGDIPGTSIHWQVRMDFGFVLAQMKHNLF